MKKCLAVVGAVLASIAIGKTAQAGPMYSITSLGLTGDGYTSTDGRQYSSAISLNDHGHVTGYSQRYNGNTSLGFSAWLFDSTSNATQQIGLTGAGYTKTDGYQYSQARNLNANGQVTGDSQRYNGITDLGTSAWLFDSTSNATQQIGLTGAGYTRADGYHRSYAQSLSDSGQAIGFSLRYNGDTALGTSVWLFDSTSGSTQQIGLTGNGYTRADGYQSSSANSLNNHGQIIGHSSRYYGNTSFGTSAWLFDSTGSSIQQLGLTGGGFTRRDGYQSSQAVSLNNSGQVIGNSTRFGWDTNYGQAAWFFDSTTKSLQQIGLTGPGYSGGGYQYSQAVSLNGIGQVIGNSARYSGSTSLGSSAWFFDSTGNTTQQMGLTGSEHTATGGVQQSTAAILNNNGQAIGYSDRFNGYTFLGTSAWFFDSTGNSTQQIGLTESDYTRTDGYQFSQLASLNDNGQAIGHSYRYNGSIQSGQSAWFFDFASQQQFDLTFSVNPATNYANTFANYLADDGTVLGSFYYYDNTNSPWNHAFRWNMTDGFSDLGLLVEGGLDANGWKVLYSATQMNSTGKIVGGGIHTNGSQGAYLLTPVQTAAPVPEPATILLFGTGLVGVVVARRKKKS